MTTAVDPLNGLGMWHGWQDRVRAALPNYAGDPWYLEQASLTAHEVDLVVATIDRPIDPDGMARDVVHGARAFPTRLGDVTRAWVDSNIEIDFLQRRMGDLSSLDVLDIGAGYGRLAVSMSPLVRSYTCVDAVPVSTEVCRDYTARYAQNVGVIDVAQLRAATGDGSLCPTLAINIHSWNECSIDQIAEWLGVLHELCVPYLFTVSHGQNPDAFPSGRTPSGTPVETPYRAWGDPSFKPLLLGRYELISEESIGISGYPHALWRRRTER